MDKLQGISNQQHAVLLAFIAPYGGKKISPVDWVAAVISFWEELGIEQAVREIKSKLKSQDATKLYLLLETPGGSVASSYKIARYLRHEFSDITVFIPNVAASGGTLISLAANRVVMGNMANLTPIDIQVPYKDGRVSVNRMASALTRLKQFFETKRPEQVPYPYRALVDKLDPIIYDDWNSKTYAMITYVVELLTEAGYPSEKISNIIGNFVTTTYPHDFIIHKNRARGYDVNVVPDEEFVSELNCLRWWLKKYLISSGTDHYIRYIIPTTQGVKQGSQNTSTQ